MIPDDEISNFQLFRDCLSTPLIEKSTGETGKKQRKARAGRKTAIKPVTAPQDTNNDIEELADFIDYLATEIFITLPDELRALTYSTWTNSPQIQDKYSLPLDTDTTEQRILNGLSPSITDSFQTYALLPTSRTPYEFLTPILNSFLSTLTATPPPPSLTKKHATECEICERSWIPLTYHHLVPRETHGKAIRRGWHTADVLDSVAWICRACHSFVHRVLTNEELARDFYTVDRLRDREDVAKFAAWVGKVRWKSQ